jgi:toxin ParE1/3/4
VARRYTLSPEAQQDLIEIRDYYLETAGARVARYVLGEIVKALQLLAHSPGVGHKRQDLTDEAVKFWPIFAYLIVYDTEMRPLRIARVLHGSRDLERIFTQLPPRM